MKTILTFIAVLFVGCEKAELEAENKRLKEKLAAATQKDDAKANPKISKKDALRLSVVGSYENNDRRIAKIVFHENGKAETLVVGEKDFLSSWKMIGNEIHLEADPPALAQGQETPSVCFFVFIVTNNSDLALIAFIEDDDRNDVSGPNRQIWRRTNNPKEFENRKLEAELKEKREKLAAEEKNQKLKDDLRRLEVVGTYEVTDEKDVIKLVILENGDWEGWENGKLDKEGTFEIVGEEIHLDIGIGKLILKIQPNGDLTLIVSIDDEGNRVEHPKGEQKTLKKIK